MQVKNLARFERCFEQPKHMFKFMGKKNNYMFVLKYSLYGPIRLSSIQAVSSLR